MFLEYNPCCRPRRGRRGRGRPAGRDDAGESRPTAAIPMEDPYCSCKLTRVVVQAEAADPAKASAGLGEVWETLEIAVKPYPSCRWAAELPLVRPPHSPPHTHLQHRRHRLDGHVDCLHSSRAMIFEIFEIFEIFDDATRRVQSRNGCSALQKRLLHSRRVPPLGLRAERHGREGGGQRRGTEAHQPPWKRRDHNLSFGPMTFRPDDYMDCPYSSRATRDN